MLGKQCEGYSAADIIAVIKAASLFCQHKVTSSNFFKILHVEQQDWYYPCIPEDEEARKMTYLDVPLGKLMVPQVEVEDVYKALSEYKPAVKKNEMKKLKNWADKYGEGNIKSEGLSPETNPNISAIIRIAILFLFTVVVLIVFSL